MTSYTKYWKVIGQGGDAAYGQNLRPGWGYTIGLPDQRATTGHQYRTLRFPLDAATLIASEKNASKDVLLLTHASAHPGASVNDQGLNMIGNPYMKSITVADNGSDNSRVKFGYLEKVLGNNGQWTGAWEMKYTDARYAVFYDPQSKTYSTKKLNGLTIQPFTCFYVQVEDATTMTFASSALTGKQSAPWYATAKKHDIEVDIWLRQGAKEDRMGLLFGNNYTSSYDIQYDMIKMIERGIGTYMLIGDVRQSDVALPFELAEHTIPVGVQIPSSGWYTFEIRDDLHTDDLSHIWLTDHEDGIMVDLMMQPYEFNAEEGLVENRFELRAELKADNQLGTSDEYLMGEPLDNIRIWNSDMVISLAGVPQGAKVYVYSADGKLIYMSVAQKNDVHIKVPTRGVYNVRVMNAAKAKTMRTLVR